MPALRNPRALAAWALGSLVLFVLTWPVHVGAPEGNLDPSWNAGLQMAWRDGLQFGRDLIFTYGPWGFVERPVLYDAGAYRLAIAYWLLIRAAEVLLVWLLVSRTWGRTGGWLVALLVLCAMPIVEPRTIVALAAAILILSDVTRRVPLWAVAGLGAWAAFELLGKQSTGVQVFLVLAAALALGPRPRRTNLAVFAGAALGALLLAWLVAGQDLGALPDFLRGSLEIVAGYAGAMSFENPSLRWAYWGALAVAIAVVLGLRASSQSPRAAVPGLVLVSALTIFLAFKQAFVRLDGAHVVLYFSTLVALVALLPWGPRHRSQALLALLLAVVCVVGAGDAEFGALFNPRSAPSDLRQAVRLTYSSGERDRLVAQGRANMLATYALTPQTVAALQGHTVHVVPWEIGAAWALRLNWRPLPVFQDYSAYTSYLDERNADRLGDDAGPERVLQGEGTIDGRLPAWEPPRQAVELMCRYRPVTDQPHWRVLERSADRCGPARQISEVRATWGEAVPVPPAPPGELLLARVSGLEPHGLEVLRSIAYKPEPRYAKLDGTLVRVIPATATGGLLLRAPVTIDPPGPWHRAPSPATITFLRGAPDSPQPRGDLHISFQARPVR